MHSVRIVVFVVLRGEQLDLAESYVEEATKGWSHVHSGCPATGITFQSERLPTRVISLLLAQRTTSSSNQQAPYCLRHKAFFPLRL